MKPVRRSVLVALCMALLVAACGDSTSPPVVTVDLDREEVIAPDGTVHRFAIDAARREALLAGLDDIGLTLRAGAEIAAWQQTDRAARPWAWFAAVQQQT